LGGIVLLFIDNYVSKSNHPKKKISLLKAVTIGFGNVHDAWNEPVSSFHYWWHAAGLASCCG
jgi:hypothetical protein